VDYAKGTRQQLEAFERMLLRRPELAGRVKLLLVTVSAADGMAVYKAEQTKIEQLVGRINGHFGTMSWLPIMLSTTPLPFEEVVCAYRAADIAWITPLRDGLNLVCKEFVAAKNGESGVLVLSEFAGSAMELSDAVLVNPFSRDSMDDGLDQALDMPLQERSERMQRLLAHVRKYDLAYWTKHVMSQFAKLTAEEKRAP
jgi:glucosylglycerol-phosphate synthase